jgi:hypothetical protein
MSTLTVGLITRHKSLLLCMTVCAATLAPIQLNGELDELENVTPELVISQPLFFPLANYQGLPIVQLGPGRYTQAELAAQGIANNSISSIRMQPGYAIKVWDNGDFTGDSIIIYNDTANLALRGFDNRLSSMRITKIPLEGLVASYRFNGNTRDATRNHFDCNAMNGAHLTTNRLGRANAAYAFDGIDDFIECPTDPRLGVHVGADVTASVLDPSRCGKHRKWNSLEVQAFPAADLRVLHLHSRSSGCDHEDHRAGI